MELKVHIEDHRDLLMGGVLAAVGIGCLMMVKREFNRLNKMKRDLDKKLDNMKDDIIREFYGSVL